MAAVWNAGEEETARATFAFVSDKKVGHRDIALQQQLIRETFHDIQWEIPKMLDIMNQAPDFYFDVAAQIDMKHWFKDRVALTGDAAYCASPMSGQGLSLAIIGSFILAGELAEVKGNFKAAFEAYELILRPFIKLNQNLGIQAAELFKSTTNKGLLSWCLIKLMNLLPGFIIKFFIERATNRIRKVANSIELKDYSEFYSQSCDKIA